MEVTMCGIGVVQGPCDLLVNTSSKIVSLGILTGYIMGDIGAQIMQEVEPNDLSIT